MKLKTITTDGKTYAEVQDGKPVYTTDDGKEIAFDAVGTAATIQRLNGEAKGHREAKEAAETKLKAFEGIADPAAALKALGTLKNLDDKKLVDAGEVEKVKAEVAKAYEERLATETKKTSDLEATLNREMIGGAFARSKFATEKLAIPTDFVQARFGDRFKLEDGKVTAYDHAGNKLYSKTNPGNPADFDEALELLVDAYPQKDSILKGSGHKGDGAKGSNGANGSGGPKTMTRSAFDALDQMSRATKMREGFTLTE